jgi:hypothetical protein
MKKIAYFDCFSGISGDMTVGAFLDAGLKFALLRKRLGLLDADGYKISAVKQTRNGLQGTKFDVKIDDKHRFKKSTLKDIKKIINKSRLSPFIKSTSILIFDTLAAAEAKVHAGHKNDIHFHEVGDMDSIIDIVSTAVAVEELGIKEFYCLNLKLGKGNIASMHGNFPLPAPAAAEMLKHKPVSFIDTEYELVTPTGAAILTTLVKDFYTKPEIDIEEIGYGAGAFNIKEQPNLLRVMIGKAVGKAFLEDEIFVIETNIDDMSPAYYEYLFEALFAKGALDVYITNVYMKKTRPGVLLTVLAREGLLDILAGVIMRETTSSGIRYYKAGRKILERHIKIAKTMFGPIRVKVNSGPGRILTVSPEYEDCRKAAKRSGLSLKAVFDEARKKIS